VAREVRIRESTVVKKRGRRLAEGLGNPKPSFEPESSTMATPVEKQANQQPIKI